MCVSPACNPTDPSLLRQTPPLLNSSTCTTHLPSHAANLFYYTSHHIKSHHIHLSKAQPKQTQPAKKGQRNSINANMHGADCPKCGASSDGGKSCSSCGAVSFVFWFWFLGLGLGLCLCLNLCLRGNLPLLRHFCRFCCVLVAEGDEEDTC